MIATIPTRNVMSIIKTLKKNKKPYIIMNNSTPSALLIPYSESILKELSGKFPDEEKIWIEMKSYYQNSANIDKEWELLDIDN